jgi:N-acetylglutamate synthase-like GNAT family acetyltransferase
LEALFDMDTPVEIRQIYFGTDEYKEELQLRNRVLRMPLGLSLFDENLTKEVNDFHIGAFDGKALIGVLILTVLGEGKVKMRQVGVEENWRGKNVGARLAIYAEDFARKLGYSMVVLNARKSVVGFYEKLGYEKIGGEFIEVTIPHQTMQKKLAQTST